MKKIMIIGITLIFVFCGCQQKNSVKRVGSDLTKNENTIQFNVKPEEFLEKYDLKVQANPEKFKVKVPAIWDVNSGDYPIGLYWNLVNEFSKDVGLDLSPLKGNTVEVWRYALADGLPGQGKQSNFLYPSNVILLVDGPKVVGAWLAFNRWGIGPSAKKRYLKDITGLTYEEWIEKEGLFSSMGQNKDLASLEPVELLKAFFKAINDGDKERAYSCLSPDEMLSSLTVNLGENCLYNSGFSGSNSMVENIIKAKPISFKLLDTKNFDEIKSITDQKEIEVGVNLEIQWRNSQFNSPNGKDVRFTIMRKYKNGWKLNGLGTGP